MKNEEKNNKPIYKKWWFWVIVVLFIIVGISSNNGNDSIKSNNTAEKTDTTNATITYTLTGNTIGEYGKEIILNEKSDMPTKKYVYKIESGTYKVTTTNEKLTQFSIVKDVISNSGDGDYSEELTYVGQPYLITNGNDDFNGKAKKTVEITIEKDESLQIVGDSTIVLEKQ